MNNELEERIEESDKRNLGLKFWMFVSRLVKIRVGRCNSVAMNKRLNDLRRTTQAH